MVRGFTVTMAALKVSAGASDQVSEGADTARWSTQIPHLAQAAVN